MPAIALTVWLMSRLGVGDPRVELFHVIRMTGMFAGVAALVTAGGIGRVAAYASVARTRRGAMWVAARTHAVASIGLVLIAAIPHGDLPERPVGFLAYAAAGLVTGAVCGTIIGGVCSGATVLGLAEVWSLAKRPSDALKHMFAPEDFARLGAAMRNRTSKVFEGMFDPAALPPAGAQPAPTSPAERGSSPATAAKAIAPPPTAAPATAAPATAASSTALRSTAGGRSGTNEGA